MAVKDSLVADCLFRVQVGSVHLAVDYFAMATDQLVDSDIQAFRLAVTGLLLQDVRFLDKGATLLSNVSTGQPCPMVPAGWRCCIFDAIHALLHPSS